MPKELLSQGLQSLYQNPIANHLVASRSPSKQVVLEEANFNGKAFSLCSDAENTCYAPCCNDQVMIEKFAE